MRLVLFWKGLSLLEPVVLKPGPRKASSGVLTGPASLILFSCVASVQVSVYLYGRLVLVIFIYNLDKSFSFLKYIYLS